MAFKITNKGGAPLSLPFPLSGILGPGKSAVVDLTESELTAIFGAGAAWVELDDVGSASSDTAYEGASQGGQIASPLSVSGDVTSGGDLAAVGGFRTLAGPFVAPGAAGVTAASQTDLDCRYSHVVADVIDFVATRAGSIMGLSGALDTAVTGGGFDISVEVTINGVEVVGGPVLTFTQVGAEVADSAVIAKDVAGAVFAAGDTIGVSYSSTAITNTPKLVVTVELEQ